MSWRSELKLADLPADEALEITCPKCGAARYATAAELSAHKMPGALDGETVSLATAYLDQVEAIALSPVRWARTIVPCMAGQDQRVCRRAALNPALCLAGFSAQRCGSGPSRVLLHSAVMTERDIIAEALTKLEGP
jgi:hypothetical protein